MTVLEGALAPLSTSTPVCVQQDNQLGADDTPNNQPFQPIIPGISHASLYPALSALSSEVPLSTGSPILYYEQVINDTEEQERIAFATSTEGWHRSTNTTPVPDVDFQLDESQGEPLQEMLNAAQVFTVPDTLSLESLAQDTSNKIINAIQEPGLEEQDHLPAQTEQDLAENIVTSDQQQEPSNTDEQVAQTSEDNEVDEGEESESSQTSQNEHYSTAIDDRDDTVQLGHPIGEPLLSHHIRSCQLR